MTTVRESSIESYFCDKARRAGMLTYKFTSPSNSGVPDRILIHEGIVYFIELKAPGKKPRKLQKETVRRMRTHGARVYCISNTLQVNRFLYEVLLSGFPKPEDYDPI